ncbi:serine/threonine-protein kinase [Actinoplanes philippinensis]|uniref:serine/threonine-protein kinase n=1 Tax=Actinoplanes philippinensis TaxID=35752 RepID=UPI0033DA81D1
MPHTGELLGGRYRLDDRIAAGGMGEVWQATDTVLGRAVAVKTLLADRATDPGFQRRFRHEAQALAALRHPGVVPVYDFGNTAVEDAYLVMARVEGQPLNRILAERGRLTPTETMSVVAQAAQALEAAHEAGIVHRDVKPGNLLVEPDGTVVLVDFGVARSANSATVTNAGEVVGTALYIAPEQVAQHTAGPPADVYALGALAYHCLAGHPPFQGRNPIAIALQHLEDEPPALPSDVPPPVSDMVRTALSKSPADRFPSAGIMAEAARSAAATLGGAAFPSVAPLSPALAPGSDTAAGTLPASGFGTASGPPAAPAPGTAQDPPAVPGSPTPGSDTAAGTLPASGFGTASGSPAAPAPGTAQDPPAVPGSPTPGSSTSEASGAAPGNSTASGSEAAPDDDLAATRAGSPWIGVLGMQPLDRTAINEVLDDTAPGTAAANATGIPQPRSAPVPNTTPAATAGVAGTDAADLDARGVGAAGAGAVGAGAAGAGAVGAGAAGFAGAEAAGTGAAGTGAADPDTRGVGAAGAAAVGAGAAGFAGTEPAVMGATGADAADPDTRGVGAAGAGAVGAGAAGFAGAEAAGTGAAGASTGATGAVTANGNGYAAARPVMAGDAATTTRPATPVQTPPGTGATGGDAAGRRRLPLLLVLAAVVLLGGLGALVAADPLGWFADEPKPTTNAPAAPVSSAPRSAAPAGGGNDEKETTRPDPTSETEDDDRPTSAAPTSRPADGPAPTEPTATATTGDTATPTETATTPEETGGPDDDETEPGTNEDGGNQGAGNQAAGNGATGGPAVSPLPSR